MGMLLEFPTVTDRSISSACTKLRMEHMFTQHSQTALPHALFSGYKQPAGKDALCLPTEKQSHRHKTNSDSDNVLSTETETLDSEAKHKSRKLINYGTPDS